MNGDFKWMNTLLMRLGHTGLYPLQQCKNCSKHSFTLTVAAFVKNFMLETCRLYSIMASVWYRDPRCVNRMWNILMKWHQANKAKKPCLLKKFQMNCLQEYLTKEIFTVRKITSEPFSPSKEIGIFNRDLFNHLAILYILFHHVTLTPISMLTTSI